MVQVPHGISGVWKVTSSFGMAERQNQIDLVMVLYQSGDEITGSLGPSADRQLLTISEGRFRTSNQEGVTIQGTGTGKVQADRMTFEWSAMRDGQRLQGKLEFIKTD